MASVARVPLSDFASAGPARVSVSDRARAGLFCAWRGRVLSRSTRLRIRYGMELGLKE
jgi:hypothetical protein